MPRTRNRDESQKLWNTTNVQAQYSVNKWAARIVPAILIGVVGYSVWAIVVILCINYLIHPPAGVPRRLGAGIAIIVIYFVLMVPMTLCYFRILQTIATNPGYVPRRAEADKDKKNPDRKRRRTRGDGQTEDSVEEEKDDYLHSQADGSGPGLGAYTNRDALGDGSPGPAPGLEFFYKRDIFECETDGLPRWCSTCKIWKPDRSHHSSELGKCVYKMDHFCPWAGGIISESNFKFFIQFCTYAALFCLFLLVISAYFSAEQHHQLEHYSSPVLSIIAISALFLLFSFTMAYNSLFFVLINSTTVDNLSRRTKIYHFAVLIPSGFVPAQAPIVPPSILQTTSQYPTPLATTLSNSSRPEPWRKVTYPLHLSSSEAQSAEPNRTFAILATPAGSNPYSLSKLENLRTVMGEHWYDWLLPVRHSPCWDNGHDQRRDGQSDTQDQEKAAQRGHWADHQFMYKTGSVVDDMIRRAGLPPLQRG